MRFCLLTLLPVFVISLAACEKPCPKGQQRYGADCVMSPVPDAGRDAGNAGGNGKDGGTNTQDDGGLSSCVPPSCHPCEMKPCQNGGICSETATGFECACKVGFSGRTCGLDPCELDPCVRGECVRKASGRECKCEPGYVGDACDLNGNAALATLDVSPGQLYPAFSPDTYSYSVDLGISAPRIQVTPTAVVPGGVSVSVDTVIQGDGAPGATYSVGLNTSRLISITVRAEDGTELTYKITVRRTFAQRAYIKRNPSGIETAFGGDQSGALFHSLALDDELMAVGRPRDAGRVELFAWDGSAWGPRFAVTAGHIAKPDAQFGASVALSEEWMIVGAPGEDSQRGAIYALRRSTLGSGGPDIYRMVSSAPLENQRFGEAIAVHGSRVAVGVPKEAVVREGVAQRDVGAVYIFEFDGIKWTGPVRLVQAVGQADHMFGRAVALDKDRLVVGVPGDDGEAGAVGEGGAIQVFEQRGSGWESTATIRAPGSFALGFNLGVSGGRIASTSIRLCAFGCSGQPDAFIFALQDNMWVQEPVLQLPRAESTTSARDPMNFGVAGVAFTGKVLVVSAVTERNRATGINPSGGVAGEQDTGAVYVYVKHDDGWKMDAYVKASNAEAGDGFGWSLAAHADTIIASAPGERSAATDIDGDQSDNTLENAGAVYLFSTNCNQVPSGADVPGC